MKNKKRKLICEACDIKCDHYSKEKGIYPYSTKKDYEPVLEALLPSEYFLLCEKYKFLDYSYTP